MANKLLMQKGKCPVATYEAVSSIPDDV